MAYKWFKDLFKEVQLSDVMQQRVALAEERHQQAVEKIEALTQENQALKQEVEVRGSRIAELEEVPNSEVSETSANAAESLPDGSDKVLMVLFEADGREDREVHQIAHQLNMKLNVLQYHLDQLKEAGFARRTGMTTRGLVYWGVSAHGRKYAVEELLGGPS